MTIAPLLLMPLVENAFKHGVKGSNQGAFIHVSLIVSVKEIIFEVKNKKGEVDGDFKDNMVTFMAGIFRSVRFGASSAHGKANMVRFNFFKEKGAFTRSEDGTYKVDFDKMIEAMEELSSLILTLQGNGDYDGVANLVTEKGVISEELQADLDRLSESNIPVDVIFEQGKDVLGL